MPQIKTLAPGTRNITDVLIARRSEMGLTQTRVARLMEIEQSHVSKLESRFDTDWGIKMLQRYAAALKLRLVISFEEIEDEE